MHILIIDDEIAVIDNLALYLRYNDHTSMELTRIRDESALHAQLEEIQPDAVILDFGMQPPGDVVYRWIKRWNDQMPVIFYTNYAESTAEHHRMRQSGAGEEEIIAKRDIGSDVGKILKVLS